jgi:AcrR family transcriptional regulator
MAESNKAIAFMQVKLQRVASPLALVLTAERLFAEKGIGGVSLRQINEAAGQRNASGLQYHFGSREGILRAVLEHRMPDIDRDRRACLGRPGERDVRFYLRAFVEPLSAQLRPRPEGNYYLRFIHQFARESPPVLDIAHGLIGGAEEVWRALHRLMAYLPARVIEPRLAMSTQLILSELARIEASGPSASDDATLLVANLLDVAVGGLLAPVSPVVLEAV